MMRLSSEQRVTMGERARNRILENFRLEAILDRWVILYEDLLRRRPMPSRRGISTDILRQRQDTLA
jgi:hypothetical protein